ncbi:MAG TPA: 2-amino-4-hydroxy-6-hydroxymethyldihydropteridine diphosphokinase [Kiloniellales bacterium]|nr:2-amino-4-hydroxy-6-hydroxymethyldihydropteridine diphosphokinase [Kiloniellales bacterium]
MIFIGLGANLPSPRHGPPRATLEAALSALEARGLGIRRRSRWYRSAPQPPSDQPWFVNGVAELAPGPEPAEILALLHRVEADFGRVRRERNEARLLDLDLLAYDERVSGPGEQPELPHPRMAERGFVLVPLAELAPGWRHPQSGLTVEALIGSLPPESLPEPLE